MRHPWLRSSPSLPRLPHWRRRWLLAALASGGWLGLLARADAAVAVAPRRPKRQRAAATQPHLQPHLQPQPPALRAFIDHLIPADDLTPAASTLQVHQRVWDDARTQADGVRLLRTVCQWLDGYGDGFATLSEAERETLVAWMSTAPWESPQRRFFHWVRERAFAHYYSQPASWRGLPVQRPPQPMGHKLD